MHPPDTHVAPNPTAPPYARMLVVLTSVYVLSFVDRQLLSILIEPIKTDLRLTDTQVSLLGGAAFAVCYSIASLPLGRLADRMNRARLIAAGLALWSLMTIAGGMATGFWGLFASRMGIGIGEAALVPAAYSLLAERVDRARFPFALSLFVAGAPVGSGASVLIGGALLTVLGAATATGLLSTAVMRPWQWAFVLVGAVGFVLVPLVLRIEDRSRVVAPTVQAEPPEATLAFLRRDAGYLLPFIAGLTVFNVYVYGALTWLPSFFMRTHGWSALQAGQAVGLSLLLLGGAGAPLGGALIARLARAGRRFAAHEVALAGCALLLPVAVVGPLVDDAAVAALLLAFVPLGVFVTAAAAPAALLARTPAMLRGRVSALYLLIGNLIGIGAGPTVVALLTDRLYGDAQQLRSSLAVSALLLLGLAVPLLALARARASSAADGRAPRARGHELECEPGARRAPTGEDVDVTTQPADAEAARP
jgi:MFS family permease